MTFEKIRVDGLDDDDNDLANHLLGHLDRKLPRNLLRESFYDGKRAARQISAIVPPQYHRLGLVLGWSAKAVDALARRCRLDGFRWTGGKLDSLGMSVFAEENQLLSELSAATTNHLKLSVAFLINTTGAEGEPKSLLHAKNATNATGIWNSRLRRLDAAISILERKEDRVTEFVLYLYGRTITCRDDSGWVVMDDQTHPYGMPVEAMPYKPQTREFGSSRISRPIMGLQDAAVRTLIRMEGHMDIYSYPELMLLGADASVFKDANGNTMPAWQVMMGRVKAIPDDPDVDDASLARVDAKQFPASSPTPHLAQLNALAKMFAREASLPDTAVAITDMANPTGADSYDASQYELVAEAEGVVDDMSRPVGRAVRRGLQILNGLPEMPEAWRTIVPKWANPRYESRAQAADAGAKQLAALPWLGETEVGLELLGLEEDQITRALAEKRRVVGRQVVASLGATSDNGN